MQSAILRTLRTGGRQIQRFEARFECLVAAERRWEAERSTMHSGVGVRLRAPDRGNHVDGVRFSRNPCRRICDDINLQGDTARSLTGLLYL